MPASNDKERGKSPQGVLHVPCAREDKAAWVRRAQQVRGRTLREWVIATLNRAADAEPGPEEKETP